ncbi:MAG: HAD-IC family P-type ATPase [Acidimicrobiales bacterium]
MPEPARVTERTETTGALRELRGLTGAEVAIRRARGQSNEVTPGTSRSYRQIFAANVLTRFNAILGVLLAVIVIVGPFQDGLFGAVLVSNALIGIFQELRAKRTLDRLALVNAPSARVWRDGVVREVSVAELVMDDVVVLGRGDQVAVDALVLDGTLEIDESLLSGEADPVAKPEGATVMSGSFVASGNGTVRVTSVGADSYAQRLASEARRFTLSRSELRDGINRILRLVQWTLVPVAALLIVSQLAAHRNLPDAIRGCVAGVGSMIPEGLVLLTSVAFALAVVRLGRRRVLVQELAAVEGLARVDILCVDKTGTLTAGGIHVRTLEVLSEGDAVLAAEALAALAAAEPHPNPTLAAIAAQWPGGGAWEPIAATPFSSARKWSASSFVGHDSWVLGAPEVVMADAPADLRHRIEERASAGDRVVLLARSASELDADRLPADLRPVGIVLLAEELRPDAADTIAYFRAQHVAIRVISGDHPRTVGAMALAAGVEGADDPVDARGLDDRELSGLVASRTVFGRVSPRQKRTMVAALQAEGHVVAMTGDGVNDVLALKDADIGVAMGSGSAAARSVAQLVLLDDAFAALPPVIAEGRRVIANVERVASLFLVKTVYATAIALMVGVSGVAYPFLPRHLTIVSDLTIGIPAFFLALLPNTRVFRPGFVGRVLRVAVPFGIVASVATMAVYFMAYRADLPLAEGRTAATVTLVAVGLWVLVILARPFNAFKVGLVAVMLADFVGILAIGPVRRYFALRLPGGGTMTTVAVVAVLAGIALEGVARGGRSVFAPDA